MSDTPETDRAYVRGFEALMVTNDEDQWVRADFARRLERERDAARREVERLRHDLSRSMSNHVADLNDGIERK